MCNLYSITTNQAAIAALFRVVNRYVGNPPPMPGVFPDFPAPVVRNAGANRDDAMKIVARGADKEDKAAA
jgi:putative SOS response-associated peptidase YedK